MGASGSLACIHPVVPPTTFPPCLFPRCSLQPGKTLPGIHPWKISSQAAVGWEKGYCRRSQRSQGLRAGHTGRFRWLPRSAIPLPVSPAPLPLALPTLFLVISWAHSRKEPGNFPTSLETPRLRLAWEREPRRPYVQLRLVHVAKVRTMKETLEYGSSPYASLRGLSEYCPERKGTLVVARTVEKRGAVGQAGTRNDWPGCV